MKDFETDKFFNEGNIEKKMLNQFILGGRNSYLNMPLRLCATSFQLSQSPVCPSPNPLKQMSKLNWCVHPPPGNVRMRLVCHSHPPSQISSKK